MQKEFRDRPQERRILLSLLFGGFYPTEKNSPLEPDQPLLRLRRPNGADAFGALKQHGWVKIVRSDSRTTYLSLSESGFMYALDDAKAILRTRFLLGLTPIPSGEGVEFTTDSQVASALLLFLHLTGGSFFDGAIEFLGIVDDGKSEELVSEFLAQRLVVEEDYPRFHEVWYKLTAQGRARCECWLSGLPRPVDWPFRALPLANRRHNPIPARITRLSSNLDMRALSSTELELLAFEYAKRELKLKNIRHVGGPNDGKSDLLAEDHCDGNLHGVVLQCKQTAESSLRLASIRKELADIQLPDCEKPWNYILFTNAKDSRRLGDIVAEGTRIAGFIHATIVAKTSLESFLADNNNQDLIPRFFPRIPSSAPAESECRMPRRYEWHPSLRIEHFQLFLQRYFPDNRGKLIVRDLEYEDAYPRFIHPTLMRGEWIKVCVMGFDEEGLIYGDTSDGKLYRIPYRSMVLWDQWTRDPWEGLPHLYVAGLDRIEPLNRSYG